jgi:hypothetical protein
MRWWLSPHGSGSQSPRDRLRRARGADGSSSVKDRRPACSVSAVRGEQRSLSRWGFPHRSTPTAEVVISSRGWASTVVLWTSGAIREGDPCDGKTGAASLKLAADRLRTGECDRLDGSAADLVHPLGRRAYPWARVNVVAPGLDDVAFRNPGREHRFCRLRQRGADGGLLDELTDAEFLPYQLPAG